MNTMAVQGDIQTVLYEALATCRDMSVEAVIAQLAGGAVIDSLEGIEMLMAAEGYFGVTLDESLVTPELCSSIPRLAAAVESMAK